jgi:hypothetical protein
LTAIVAGLFGLAIMFIRDHVHPDGQHGPRKLWNFFWGACITIVGPTASHGSSSFFRRRIEVLLMKARSVIFTHIQTPSTIIGLPPIMMAASFGASFVVYLTLTICGARPLRCSPSAG